jgi:hypothetical protein
MWTTCWPSTRSGRGEKKLLAHWFVFFSLGASSGALLLLQARVFKALAPLGEALVHRGTHWALLSQKLFWK